jgi:hypothetical protein
MKRIWSARALLASSLLASTFAGAGSSLFAVCGPFTDAAADSFCPLVLEIFYLGITTGTTATTFDPSANVSRLQMAAFLSRTVDGVLGRGNRRAALKQFWTNQGGASLGSSTISLTSSGAGLLESDGTDIWVPTTVPSVARLRGSDGKFLETWTGNAGFGVLSAMNRIFLTAPNSLLRIDAAGPVGSPTGVATLGGDAHGIAFDGGRIWTANLSPSSVSIVTPGATLPWTVTTVTTGSAVVGALYDGANVWVTDAVAGTLLKLSSAGAVLQTVTVGSGPQFPVFDGTNIWVPTLPGTVSVVRASSGAVLATLTGNGLAGSTQAAFDGQRILVTNENNDTVSLWKAANFSVIGSFSTGVGSAPYGACSDGTSFWIGLHGANKIVRF